MNGTSPHFVWLDEEQYECKHGCMGFCLHLLMDYNRARQAVIDQARFDDYRQQLLDFFAYRQMLIARM